ncbi:hypothetical protein ACFQVD_31745 [Streptosporangium amethystogenes subsp. fukuiense]|uniref:Uncharacterized protein n=1 Tax=Streptosporangium amethystogenes subsp. fukuiense TaxID=698418 RepID=A0ABW2T7L0_9ACTN
MNSTTKQTSDTTKLNFMADHGSTLRSTRCALRGDLGAGMSEGFLPDASSGGWGDDRLPGDHGC